MTPLPDRSATDSPLPDFPFLHPPQEPGFFQIKNPAPSCGEGWVVFEPIFQRMLMKFLPRGPSQDATTSGGGLTGRGRSTPSRDTLRNARQSGELDGLNTARPHQYSAVELTRNPRRLSLLYGGVAGTCLLSIPLSGFRGCCKCGLLTESPSFKSY